MKKFYLAFLTFSLILLGACSNTNTLSNQTKNSKVNEKAEEPSKLKVYTTVYPLSYFTERIGGDFVEVSSVYPPGANEHTFEPTQQDMIKIAEGDLLFYIGLGLESFIEKAQSSLENTNVEFIPVTTNVPEEKFNISAGNLHDEHTEDHENEHTEAENSVTEDTHTSHEEDEHEGHDEMDPHVWLSTAISVDIALSIKEALVEKLPNQAETIEANYQSLLQDLQALDGQFQEMVAQSNTRTFFVSHAAFGYIAGEYDLNQIPIAGLNSQDEPSQKELIELVALANELNINYILFEQNVSSKLAEIIQSEIGAEALTLHNLSVLTEEDIANNETYFTLMEQNIETLRKALGTK